MNAARTSHVLSLVRLANVHAKAISADAPPLVNLDHARSVTKSLAEAIAVLAAERDIGLPDIDPAGAVAIALAN